MSAAWAGPVVHRGFERQSSWHRGDVTGFAFHHTWRLPVDVGFAYAVLADVDRYAEWWPQVRTTQRIDAESGQASIRSLLPWTLHLHLTREVEDAAAGVLRVRLAGDLNGWCEWVVRDDPQRPAASARADFTQEVVVTKAGLARWAWVAAPALRANHAWMMRDGERGLVARLLDLEPDRPTPAGR